MTIEKFERVVRKIYQSLPKMIRDRIEIYIEEEPCEASQKIKPFGYWTSMTPNAITLCYWVFKSHGDFSEGHIARVIKHEFEHSLQTERHSEHHERR